MSKAIQFVTQALQAIDLAPIVSQIIGAAPVKHIAWQVERVTGGSIQYMDGGLGVFRVFGTAEQDGQPRHWTAILKIVAPAGDGSTNDQTLTTFWKREVLAYKSGLLAQLSGGLAVPQCYAIQEQPDGGCWLWLEEIKETERQWSMARHYLAASHLGQFNGAYLVDRPLPTPEPWLTSGRLHQRLVMFPLDRNQLQHFAATQLGKAWLRGNCVERICTLWEKRTSLLDTLAQLPICLCHHDAFRRNLLACKAADGSDKTVAIDWSYLGFGRVGQEIGITTAVNLQFMEIPGEQAHELDAAIFEGYCAGLADAGWGGDRRLVRFGYTTTAALSIGVASTNWLAARLTSREGVTLVEGVLGHPVDAIIAQWGEILPFLLDLGDEALSLLNTSRLGWL